MRILLKYIITPILLLLALFALINSFDRTLNPEIEEFINAGRREVPDEENAYFALLGHNAAAGLDPHAEGVIFVEELEKKFTEDREMMNRSREEVFGGQGLTVTGGEDLLEFDCSVKCLDFVRSRKNEIETLLRANKELVERYSDLYRYKHFSETASMPFSAEDFGLVRKTQKVLLLIIALKCHEDGVDAALTSIEDDLQFWRSVLGSTRRLVNKMIAIVAVQRNLRLLSGIIANLEINKEQAARIAAATAPLSEEEWELSSAMRGECAQQIEMVSRAYVDKEGKLGRAYKENATKNLVFDMCRKENSAYALPAPESLREWKRYEGERKKKKGGVLNVLKHFYNPIGRLMAEMVFPNFRAFSMKVHNLDGYLSVLKAQLEIKRRAVQPEDIPAFLEENCPDYCDPYTLQSLIWNEEEGTISFMSPLAEKPIGLTIR